MRITVPAFRQHAGFRALLKEIRSRKLELFAVSGDVRFCRVRGLRLHAYSGEGVKLDVGNLKYPVLRLLEQCLANSCDVSGWLSVFFKHAECSFVVRVADDTDDNTPRDWVFYRVYSLGGFIINRDAGYCSQDTQ